MNSQQAKNISKQRRQKRVRIKIHGTAKRPRLSVFRSNTGLYLQLIDDEAGKTVAAAHSREVKNVKKKTEIAEALGKLIAEKAIALKILEVVFDRGGNLYTGRVKAVAEGARAGGLKF
jgi:large subunit ribosomal protein L18